MTATSYAARQSFVEQSVSGYGYLDGHGRPRLVRYATPNNSKLSLEQALIENARSLTVEVAVCARVRPFSASDGVWL